MHQALKKFRDFLNTVELHGCTLKSVLNMCGLAVFQFSQEKKNVGKHAVGLIGLSLIFKIHMGAPPPPPRFKFNQLCTVCIALLNGSMTTPH